MNLSLAFSTCPNDTFIFDAIVNKRIDLGSLSFSLSLADIDVLNAMAEKGEPDIVKVSYATYPFISESYQMLTSGSALGKGVGPLVISKRKIYPDELPHAKIAIPGSRTTANLLFSIFYPTSINKKVYLFSDIEEAILSNEVDAGVIIHENRFTYQLKGLQRIVDLGELWEKSTNLPIPLGGIAVKRSLPFEIKMKVQQIVKNSVEYAQANPNDSKKFISQHAQELDSATIQKHIDLYVNSYSVDLGQKGIEAILALWQKGASVGFCPTSAQECFVM
jgi:1,4-dihydroxy-6-naphthoate synthase